MMGFGDGMEVRKVGIGTTALCVKWSAWGGNDQCCAKNAESINLSLIQINA